MAEVAGIVETGPEREKDGVVRWRRVDLKRVVAERFGVDFHERYVGTLLKKLGSSHVSARPRQPARPYVRGVKSLAARPTACPIRGLRRMGRCRASDMGTDRQVLHTADIGSS